MSVLVMGIGNLLLMDEGAGIRAVEELQKRYCFPESVEIIDGGTMGIELLHYLRNRECVIIIDVVRAGNPPGSVVRMEGDDVPAFFNSKISPHQLGLSDLLGAAQLTGAMPQKIVLLGVEPKQMDTGLALSPEVQEALPVLIARAVSEVAAAGYVPEPRKRSD